MDLVKISPDVNPPVCKIMDYGKYRYDQSKKEKENRKTTKQSELKEIPLSMTIEEHDLKTKAGHAHKFLSRADKCKVTLRMRGRQQAHKDIGIRVMNEFFEHVKDVSEMERRPTVEGRNIIMILVPTKAVLAKVKESQPKAVPESKSDKPQRVTTEGESATNSVAAALDKATKTAKKPKPDQPDKAETSKQ